MDRRLSAGTVLEAVVVLFLVAMVVGQVLGQPVLLGYVTTGSMQPTLEPGDGFVAVPAALAGDIETGDVVTFRAEQIQGGGLTTHRVVRETERGFVTRGDNNPFTDQDGGEPPVRRTDIVAVAWQPGGTVLAVPGVGTAVSVVQGTLDTVQRWLAGLTGTRSLLGTQGLAYLVLGLSLAAYVADLWLSDRRKDRSRDTSRESGIDTRLVMVAFAGALVLAATATMVAPSGPQEFEVVSAERDSPGLGVVETGTNESSEYVLGNGGLVPVVTYFESGDGAAVRPGSVVIPGRSTVNATLTLSAPPETGYYRLSVVEHRYLYVLPEPTIRALYEVHPWLPIVVIDAILGIPFYAVGIALGGRGRVRSNAPERPSRLGRVWSRLSGPGD